MYHYYYAEPFDLMYTGTDSGNQQSLASYTNLLEHKINALMACTIEVIIIITVHQSQANRT